MSVPENNPVLSGECTPLNDLLEFDEIVEFEDIQRRNNEPNLSANVSNHNDLTDGGVPLSVELAESMRLSSRTSEQIGPDNVMPLNVLQQSMVSLSSSSSFIKSAEIFLRFENDSFPPVAPINMSSISPMDNNSFEEHFEHDLSEEEQRSGCVNFSGTHSISQSTMDNENEQLLAEGIFLYFNYIHWIYKVQLK